MILNFVFYHTTCTLIYKLVKCVFPKNFLQKLFADLCHFVLIQQNWQIYQANKSYKTPVCLRALKLLETDPPRTNLHFRNQTVMTPG